MGTVVKMGKDIGTLGHSKGGVWDERSYSPYNSSYSGFGIRYHIRESTLNLRQMVKDLIGLYVLGWLTWFAYVKDFFTPLYRLVFASRRPVIVRTPEDRFVGASLDEHGYNFTSNYTRIPFGSGRNGDRPRMHYIDECLNGDPTSCQETVLLLHGATSWSFTYRKLIHRLVSARYRVVAPDLIGFGKSDKYTDAENYTHELHTFAVKHLMNELGLGYNVIVVGQDLGGIVGMSVVKDGPEKFSGLVLINSGLPTGFSVDDLIKENPLEVVRTNLPFFVLRATVALFGTSLPIGQIFSRVYGFDSKVSRAYTAPFPVDNSYRNGVTRMIMNIPVYRDDSVSQHMVEAKACLRTWTKPVLMLWGQSDLLAAFHKKEMAKLAPQAKVVTVPGAGMMMTETHGAEVSNAVLDFLNVKNICQ